MSRALALDPVAPSAERYVALVRCTRAQLARWIASADGVRARVDDGGGGSPLTRANATTRGARSGGGEKTWTIEADGVVDVFHSIADEGRATVVRGEVRFESANEGRALETVGTAREKLRPKRSLEDGTARRVKMRGEEELREKRERHLKVVEVDEVAGREGASAATSDGLRRDLERWSRVVAAAMLDGSGSEFSRVKAAVMSLLFERPLSENAIRDCVAKGFALACKPPPNQRVVRETIKHVAQLRPPGRYELVDGKRRDAQKSHAQLTAAAKHIKLPKKEKAAAAAPPCAPSQPTSTQATNGTSVPTPPLQEPPRVLRNGITVDLGDRSPSIDLDPHAHVFARRPPAKTREIAPRAAGDDDDDWRHLTPSPTVDVIESHDECEALKATYDTKYDTYVSLHARLAANADEYEALRRGDDAAALLPRFASLRRERYAAMRDVFDGLHDELLRIRVAIDAFASV